MVSLKFIRKWQEQLWTSIGLILKQNCTELKNFVFLYIFIKRCIQSYFKIDWKILTFKITTSTFLALQWSFFLKYCWQITELNVDIEKFFKEICVPTFWKYFRNIFKSLRVFVSFLWKVLKSRHYFFQKQPSNILIGSIHKAIHQDWINPTPMVITNDNNKKRTNSIG